MVKRPRGKKHVFRAWLHYGDASHTPMQTVWFKGSRAALVRRILEAKRDGWPLRVVMFTKRDVFRYMLKKRLARKRGG